MEREVAADCSEGRSVARPSMLPQREHRLNQCAMRTDQARYAQLPELIARVDDVGFAAGEPVKPSNERGNRPIGEHVSNMLNSVHDASMPASRDDDQAIASVDDQRLFVGDGIDRQCTAPAHQISRR